MTAGNACPLNDGAAAVLVMSAERAHSLGVAPRARIVASSVAAIRPEIMGLGPIPAVERVLEQAGMTIADIDVIELNEAFAAQVVPCRDEWGVDPAKLNPFGGAIALGHPFGMTGARIMTTLLNDLDTLDATIGLETMCVAGGMGQAMIVERLSLVVDPDRRADRHQPLELQDASSSGRGCSRARGGPESAGARSCRGCRRRRRRATPTGASTRRCRTRTARRPGCRRGCSAPRAPRSVRSASAWTARRCRRPSSRSRRRPCRAAP